MFLIAEHCSGEFYMGWHLYLRDYRSFRRNKDGSSGWIRRPKNHAANDFLKSIGITIKGDGTCDDDGIAEFANRYPFKGRKCGGKPRGCLEVIVNEFGGLSLKPARTYP